VLVLPPLPFIVLPVALPPVALEPPLAEVEPPWAGPFELSVPEQAATSKAEVRVTCAAKGGRRNTVFSST
jgi:hypothetical protein